MPRINLQVFRTDHPPALGLGQRLPAIRLLTHVSLTKTAGWTDFRLAVIDTGAPVSLLPPLIWRQAERRELGRVSLGGVARRKECQIPAILAEVTCRLSDGVTSIGPVLTHAYLAEHDNVPTLIGMLGFIERGVLRVELARNRAFLRLP